MKQIKQIYLHEFELREFKTARISLKKVREIKLREFKAERKLSPGQTRKHCCGNILLPVHVSQFAHPGKHCCGNKICFPGRKNVSQQIQKHFCCGNNVS